MEQLEAAIRPDTSLVSVMLVNNEIGVIQVLAWGVLTRSLSLDEIWWLCLVTVPCSCTL